MLRNLRDIVTYRDLLKNLVLREVRLRYKGSALGILWSFAPPLTMFLVYYFVFSLLTKQFKMPHYE
ncbi:MAG: ABC transporter permease, partial [bacterium]